MLNAGLVNGTFFMFVVRFTSYQHDLAEIFIACDIPGRDAPILVLVDFELRAQLRHRLDAAFTDIREQGQRLVLTSSPSSVLKDCRLRGKGGDSSCETAMPGRENVLASVDVAVVYRLAFAAIPFSYSKTLQAFRASALFTAAAGLG